MNTEERDRLINELGEMQTKLERLAEHANAQIDAVEELLTDIHISSQKDKLDDTDRVATWAHHNGRFRLITHEHKEWKPLREATLVRRVEAGAHLDTVIRRIHTKMALQLEKFE